MGSNNLFKRRQEQRQSRKINIEKQKPSNWLIVCEGEKTEPNYFTGAVNAINESIDDKYKLKVNVVGLGKNTVSLVNSVEDLQSKIDKHKDARVLYGKIFVVFDKDSFNNKSFDQAIQMCNANGYIPLWSNQAIEYWFLLHFNYIDGCMDRKMYSSKINEYFKKAGLSYKYQKNDKDIYSKLCNYGSVDTAIKNAKKIHSIRIYDKPSESESCTTVYKFFDEVNERLEELK